MFETMEEAMESPDVSEEQKSILRAMDRLAGIACDAWAEACDLANDLAGTPVGELADSCISETAASMS